MQGKCSWIFWQKQASEWLTAIRLRKMMLDSTTPLLRSRLIALTAEFPDHAYMWDNTLLKGNWNRVWIPNLKQELDRAIKHVDLRCLRVASHRLTAATLRWFEKLYATEIKRENGACGTVASTNLPSIVTLSMDENFTDFNALAACS